MALLHISDTITWIYHILQLMVWTNIGSELPYIDCRTVIYIVLMIWDDTMKDFSFDIIVIYISWPSDFAPYFCHYVMNLHPTG